MENYEHAENIHHYNRRKKREPKQGLSWCKYCDMYLVSDGGKCAVCGTLNGIKKDKKPN